MINTGMRIASRVFRLVLATVIAAIAVPAGAQQAEVYPASSSTRPVEIPTSSRGCSRKG
jgi:hypothetical protein